MPRFYRKEIPATPIHFSMGRAVPFEFVDFDYGYFATDNGWEIAELEKAVLNGRGGVTEIKVGEYEDFLKKKASAPPLTSLQRQRQQIGSRLPRQSGPSLVADPAATSIMGQTQAGVPVTGVVKPQRAEGLKVDREFVKPKAGRIPASKP